MLVALFVSVFMMIFLSGYIFDNYPDIILNSLVDLKYK